MSTSKGSKKPRPEDLRPENRPYQPRGNALELIYSKDPEVVITGPAGTGKSRAALEKLHLVAQKYPGSRQLIVRKTRAALTESALVTFEEEVLPAGHPVLQAGGKRKTRHSYDYPNGSTIVVGGLDNPQKVMSTQYDVIYVNEGIECNEEDWENLTTRNRNFVVPWQQVMGDTNPAGPKHWIKQRGNAGKLRLIESRHEDNPVYWDIDKGEWTPKGVIYVAKLDALTGARKDRLRFGRWVLAEGVVYPGYDAAIHLVERFEVPASWLRFNSIDFGFTNPFVCQWWALDEDGRMFLYREIYMSGRTVRTHARQILDLTGDEDVGAAVADHDAEDRATLREEGIDTTAAHKPIGPGIEAVTERLKPAGDGRPRLFLMRDALAERDEALNDAKKPCSTAEEFDCYMRSKARAGRTQDEAPVKQNDHGMDALRYAVNWADGRGNNSIEVY